MCPIYNVRMANHFFGHKTRALFRGQRETLDAAHKALLEANRGAVWIHAASVGEFEQARVLIERLKDERVNGERRKVVVTFFSPSGYEARKNYPHADAVVYLPFATRRKAKRFLEVLQPSMAIFVKYEFWPAYLRELKKRNIPTYSISAIFRPTQRFFHWYGKGALGLLHCFTHIFVQDEASRRLLAEHGVHDCSVAGDTRFDRVHEVFESTRERKDERLLPVAQFVENAEHVVVAGSTWPEDEKLLHCWIDKMVTGDALNGVKLILVPHEINEEHLHDIFQRFKGRFVKYSDINAMPSNMSRLNILRRADVMLIDTIGLLSTIYQFGQVAYIGGGFGEGIHNTLEAAVYGMPVVFGPNYHHFREAQGLIDACAARSINDYKELEAALTTALEQHETIGAKAAAYVQSELGATDRIYNAIFKI